MIVGDTCYVLWHAVLCCDRNYVGVLQWAFFGGRSVPHLPQGLTLNAMISILATSKSAILFVVASCLSQIKWVWFQTSRQLVHIQTLDDASRGPLGAFILLFGQLVRSIAGLGAIITILSLAFDPFIQQVLVFPLAPVTENSPASTAKVSSGFFEQRHSAAITAAIINGLWSDSFNVNPICAAGDCQWDLAKTVGWCSQYLDVEAKLTTPCNSTFTVEDFEIDGSGYEPFATLK